MLHIHQILYKTPPIVTFPPPLPTYLKSLACKFLVILGNLTVIPLSSLLMHQPTRLRESKRQVQHIVLVVARLLHLVEHGLVVHDDVARAAGAGTAARAFHLQVVGLRNVEQVGAVGDGEGVRLRVFIDECYCASAGC
jgi:hypothetical protein